MAKKRIKTKKKSNSLIVRFFKIVLSIVLAFIILASSAVWVYSKLNKNGTQEEGGNALSLDFLNSIFNKGVNMNIAVFGVDADETRTDVIFVVHFDSKEQTLNLLSIPRDTKVTMTDEILEYLDEKGSWYPSGGVCKINEVHAYVGKEKDNEFSVLQIEDLLDIEIDHFIEINIEGFKNIVDTVGGVEVDVPQDMYYSDPYQDLHINLKKGLQTLDGEMAEHLVRFRSYPLGDVARVEVQQLFLKAMAQKVLSTDDIVKKIPDYIGTAYKYIKTDVSLIDILKYAKYIDDINLDNITMKTLPGSGQYVGGVSYFVTDYEEMRSAVRELFEYETANVEVEAISSEGKVIEVANGGSISGLAARNQEYLEENGFTVGEVSTFEGTRKPYTRIIVREDGMGQDIKELYSGSEISVVPTELENGIDIKIILGTNEN